MRQTSQMIPAHYVCFVQYRRKALLKYSIMHHLEVGIAVEVLSAQVLSCIFCTVL